MEKINIAELLKDSPKGMELYSPMFGKIYLEGVKDTGHAILIEVSTSCNSIHQFYHDGKYNTYYSESECLLFPSKDQRDWSKFQRPFKAGDIVATGCGAWIGILKDKSYRGYFTYAAIYVDDGKFCTDGTFMFRRLATEEEKQKLFKAIKDNGYRWNAETKTLEKLVEPEFKVGDRVKKKDSNEDVVLITDIANNYYIVETKYGMEVTISVSIQNDYELVPDKFDITTLIPFESRVLVRDFNDDEWCPAIWGVYGYGKEYPHIVVSGNNFIQCIPYEKNEHLLGTTNDCDEYYKIWE